MNLYRARYVFPVSGPVITDGAIAVEGGCIAAVGPAENLRGGPVENLGDQLLLPGFVNAHTHLELSLLRDRIPPLPFLEWLNRLPRPDRPERHAESVAGVRAGLQESLAAGVTCIGDICATGPHLEVRAASPVRTVCFLELITGALQPPHNASDFREWLDQTAPQAKPLHLMPGISPHALYSVTYDDVTALAALAGERRLPITMHVLETSAERDWLERGTGELANFLKRIGHVTATAPLLGSAIERLDETGVLRLRPLLAHVNYVTDTELDALAQAGASVAFCPRSHQYFRHGPHRWRDMLDRRINVSIGTDSLASNTTLCILDELRFLHCQNPGLPPSSLLKMGTLNGAAALGLAQHIGSLEVGKLADFVALRCDPPVRGDPLAACLDDTRPPSAVWIGGKRVGR